MRQDDPLSEQRFYHETYAEARIRVYINMTGVELDLTNRARFDSFLTLPTPLFLFCSPTPP